MEIFFLDKPKYERLYNCSFYDIDQIPFEQRAHPFWGGFLLAGYVIFTILYIPCLVAMFISDYRNCPSYKLMIQLGIIQLIGVQFVAYTAIQAMFGLVFCSAPNFKYVAEGLGSAHWILSSTTCDVLGINRVCMLYSPELARRLFEGKKLWIWMMFPFVYAAFMFWKMKPLIFNSIMMVYLVNPHYGYFWDSSGQYTDIFFLVHNISVCIIELFIYVAMIVLYLRATRVAPDEFRSKFRHEKNIFIQAILVGIPNCFGSLVYLSIQFIPFPFVIGLSLTISWMLSQGVTSVVYLAVNQTIRRAIFNKLGIKRNRVSQYSSTSNQLQVGSKPRSLNNSNQQH